MATRPQFEEPQEKRPELSRREPAEGGQSSLLSGEELQAVLEFFSLLDEWDRKQKVI
ncbi:MAG TPA: hypothetical protein VFA15_08395 [Nitrososphaera sp.]|nr:hypothetical protein [Nitrososphaera sp.]